MRITLHRSGGVAGLSWHASVDVASLLDDDARTVTMLIERAGLLALPPKLGEPDHYAYRVTIDTDAFESHSVEVSDDAVPPALWPLLYWLMARAGRESAPKGA